MSKPVSVHNVYVQLLFMRMEMGRCGNEHESIHTGTYAYIPSDCVDWFFKNIFNYCIRCKKKTKFLNCVRHEEITDEVLICIVPHE